MLAAIPAARIRHRSRLTAGYLFAAVVLLGSTGTATLRLFDLRAPESEFLCVNEARSAICKHGTHWTLPWPDADKDRLGWFRPHIDDWCINPMQKWLPGFQTVLPGSEFTEKVAKLGQFKCVAGHETPVLGGENTQSKAQDFIGIVEKSENWKEVITYFFREEPYKNLPYVYPIMNFSFLIAALLLQIYLLRLIFLKRGRI